jgi:hypothetical protein
MSFLDENEIEESSDIDEQIKKMRESMRAEVYANKRVNDLFELRLNPSTQEYDLHCNPVPQKQHLGWILDRLIPPINTPQGDKISFMKPPDDFIGNEKLHKKILKKQLRRKCKTATPPPLQLTLHFPTHFPNTLLIMCTIHRFG